MKKLSPEFCAQAKKKCKKPLIALGIVLLIIVIALVILCLQQSPSETTLVYDDPIEQIMMGNPVNHDDYDYDKIPNLVEQEIGTDAYSADTDADGDEWVKVSLEFAEIQ